MAYKTDPTKTLIRLPQVQEIAPYSRSTIYTLIARGDFPSPVKIGPRASAWIESEVLEWVEVRIANRKPTAA